MKLFRRLNRIPSSEQRQLLELFQSFDRGPEHIGHSFSEYVHEGYKSNGVVFACALVRMQLVSQAKFYWRDRVTLKRLPVPRDQFGLELINNPWPNASSADLLTRMEQDVTLAGNSYWYLGTAEGGRRVLQRLRPDWVSVLHNMKELLGYVYHPNGDETRAVDLATDQVMHYAPYPDPLKHFVGQSWLTPVARAINNYTDQSRFQSAFLGNAATPNLLVKVQRQLGTEQREQLQEAVQRKFTGPDNAYSTLVLEGGADAQIIGKSLEEISFVATRAATETEITAAAGVPAVLVGIKQGLDTATYSNAEQARRVLAMGTGRFLLGQSTEAVATLLKSPNERAELTWDEARISWYNEESLAVAQTEQAQAGAIRTLVDGGFDPESVVDAVEANDMALLDHTGLVSVQLQPPGTKAPEAESPNGQPALEPTE